MFSPFPDLTTMSRRDKEAFSIFRNRYFPPLSFILNKAMSSTRIPNLESYSPDQLDRAFGALRTEVAQETAALGTPEEREQFRLRWLGRKQGRLKSISDAWLKSAPPEARKALGLHFNQLKQQIEQALEAETSGGESTTIKDAIDVTL
ncbi:MAG: hypothetical protein ABI165_11610, partial [Bryobacteraceae bacterium]